MRRMIAPLLVAALLGAAGGYAWMRAGDERRLAEGREALVTMQFGATMPTASEQATADYWRAKYDALAEHHDASGALTESDPELLFIAANAAYRSLDPGAINRTEQLNAVIKSYAEVLKKEGAPEDAAFNYELLVRLREGVVRRRALAAAPPPLATLPSIHGHEGAPPVDEDKSSIKIIIPRRSEERDEELKSGAAPVRNRKG